MRINRFPKMAALQKERAIALGFDEDIAKAIGIAEATKYAIFKNLSYKRRVVKEKEQFKKSIKAKHSMKRLLKYLNFKQLMDGRLWEIKYIQMKIMTDIF